MASQADDRMMISERIAPGMLPRVLNSFDMTIIFVAIVLFIVNASAIQQAHQAAYTYWILGFLAFLIPGALVTAQLGQMFPQEGSLYVWTQKAFGPFWGFFAGFCAWWPGILVMVATGDAVVTLWQFVDKGGLPKAWEQGLVILAVLWFSALMSVLRLRMTQSYANWAVVFYGAAIFAIVIGLVLIWFFVSNTVVYNYSFSRLLFVSGLEQRMPAKLGTVSEKTKVPVYAIVTQTVLSSLFVVSIFNPWVSGNNNQKAYWLFQAAVTVIWCISMVLLFADIFLVKRAFPEKFEEVRVAHPYVLYASGVIGMLASAFGAYVTFRSPWTGLFTLNHWRIWLGALCGVSVLAAVAIYAISEYMHRREHPHPTPTPAG